MTIAGCFFIGFFIGLIVGFGIAVVCLSILGMNRTKED